jgi:hypothetical protein
VDSDPKAAQAMADKMGLKWPLAVPPDIEVLSQLDTSFPGVVVVAPDGTLVHNHIHQAQLLKRFVDRALAR